MDFEQIRAFLNVASLKSFSEAAEKMFVSQPSISVRIKALEEELGVKLFDRSRAREPVLTEAGKIFLDCAQSILELHDDCREKLSGKREEATGLVYIGSSTVPGTCLLPSLMASFKRTTKSAIDFNIDILDTSAVLEGVLNYSYDLGFVGQAGQDERLKYIPLMEDELVLCVKKGTLKKADHLAGVPVELLLSHHLVMREKGSATRQLLERKMAEKGFETAWFQGITYINNLEGIRQAVKEGLGSAVVSRLSVNDMVGAGSVDVFPIRDLDLKRYLYLVYHHSRILGAAARIFRDYCTGEFTK